MDSLAATQRLADSYNSAQAKRDVWRGAAMVRRLCISESQSEPERRHHEMLATAYESREAAT